MMQERPAAKKLSRAVLDLKFMKKSKEKAIVQEENEEREQLYQDQLSSLHEGAEKIVMVNSYVDCIQFLPCRLSFGGMDLDVEKLNEDKLMGLYTVVRPPPKEVLTQMDADISAEDMAARYRPSANKPTPSYIKEEEEKEEEQEKEEGKREEPNPNTEPRLHKKPKKSRLRAFYKTDIEENPEEGGRGKDFRGNRQKSSRGGRGKGNRGRRRGKGRNFNKKEEYPRKRRQGPIDGCLGDMSIKPWHKYIKRGKKRSHEGSHEQPEGKESSGQNHQNSTQGHKKVKQE